MTISTQHRNYRKSLFYAASLALAYRIRASLLHAFHTWVRRKRVATTTVLTFACTTVRQGEGGLQIRIKRGGAAKGEEKEGKGNLWSLCESIETTLNTGHACFARFLFATRSYLPAVRVQKSSLEESVGRLEPAFSDARFVHGFPNDGNDACLSATPIGISRST